VKTHFYGIVLDGIVWRLRSDRVGVTGVLRWRQIFSRAARRTLRTNMGGALIQMEGQMTAPSRNQKDRMRRRGQF
jgi:hypothetical protein